MKKWMIALMMAALLIVPMGGIAYAVGEGAPAAPAAGEFIPGDVPAQSGTMDAMVAPVNALVMCMVEQGLAYNDQDDVFLWNSLYYMLSLCGQMDERAELTDDMLILPAETVADYAGALFSNFDGLPALPREMTGRVSYDWQNDTFRLARGDAGLTILNPHVDAMMAAVRCYHLLMNIDTDAREFIAAYGNATVSTSITSAAGMTAAPAAGEKRGLEEIVEAGLKGEAGEATRALLESRAPLDVVDNVLIPALDRVGAAFEAGKVFLPQLIQSAGAAQAAFEVIRERLSGQPGQGEDRGTIVLATVKGDIHDIGKNIVKVLLENYGYTVVDLGKDVDPAAVAEAVRKHRAPLVGLSALMTTTLKSMADTITLLHLEGLPCKIMVGGAVLTPEYASQIQADFYARDAKESVDIAKRVIG